MAESDQKNNNRGWLWRVSVWFIGSLSSAIKQTLHNLLKFPFLALCSLFCGEREQQLQQE